MAARASTRAAPLIGCSGWQYRHWISSFYGDAKPSEWLAAYATRLDAVEINATFYRWPPAATFRRWRAVAPPGFRFVVKGPRLVTHLKRLLDPAATLADVLPRLALLGDALTGVLWQLPPAMGLDRARLDAFLARLPDDGTHAIEFRNASWYVDEVYAALDRRRVGFVTHDHGRAPSPSIVVGGFAYLRLHAWRENGGSYPTFALERHAAWLRDAAARAPRVCCFFNNDAWAAAPHNAIELAALLARGASVATPPAEPTVRAAPRGKPGSSGRARSTPARARRSTS